MLDGTIPESEYKHYLGVVSQETGRLARLVQNMLDITKLESGEVKGTPKNYDIWSTVTDVVLSDERRIEDGKIDIQGLGPTGTMVYADPDLSIKWSTTLWITPSSLPRRMASSSLISSRKTTWCG